MERTIKELAAKAKKDGWGKLKKQYGYPRPLMSDWLKTRYPKIFKEYQEWFDKEVREEE